MSRKKVIILFGGKSVEHDISIQSAANIYQYIDTQLFEVLLVGISIQGGWYLCRQADHQIESGDKLALLLQDGRAALLNLASNEEIDNIDAVFPVLHGTDGEDGSIQGLIKAGSLPCIGSGVLGSANSMDKLVTKRLLQQAGIPSAEYLHFDYDGRDKFNYDFIGEKLGSPFIIKPVSLGSSVGVEKVANNEEFIKAISNTFQYDNQVIIERFIVGREFEIGVLGNEHPGSTIPGEIIVDSSHKFYSFEAKYLDPEAAEIHIPAKLSPEIVGQAKSLAERSFVALNCNDYARVDLFVTKENEVLINEINTIPGFTNISMFPKLWEYEGTSYSDLITKLIDLALARHAKLDRLSTDFNSALSRSPSS